MKLVVALVTLTIFILKVVSASPILTTAQRISKHNYPVETHNVQTGDGYILTMFRIPYSPNLKNQKKQKPVVFLEHGLLSSSDSWILNGPKDALAYLLADAGFDVWMGNNRGNMYSKKHVKWSSLLPKFWDFTWNEIGLHDLPAMIDYTLHYTNEKTLHYVGHSQGTTVFLVLMSENPKYNAKIKTAHLLAPVAYMEHMLSPFAKAMGPLLGSPNIIYDLMGHSEFLPNNKFLSMMGAQGCVDNSMFQPMCSNVIFLLCGWDSPYLNKTLLPLVLESHPAGSSTNQLIHYAQEYKSGFFRKYDYGKIKNNMKYSSWSPPKYNEKNIVAPIWMYYSDNDYFAAVVDVHKLQRLLPNLKNSFHVPFPKFNHVDFVWALNVKEVINDKVVDVLKSFEKTGKA